MNDLLGKVVSHYKINELIGFGGMGVVYKAQDLNLDRTVAIKFIPSHVDQNNRQNKQFIQEAKVASALDHPNIGSIYEFEKTNKNGMYLVMAYYDGGSLKKRLERHPLDIPVVIDFCIQICQGLNRAHEAVIIHGDIKPANIMITSRNELKIVDFGVAKMKETSNYFSGQKNPGTLAYMSPEQIMGDSADFRSDIWSLGIMIYEMITTKLPFEENYDQTLIYAILKESPPPLAVIKPEIPHVLDALVKKCLEKDPDQRYQSVSHILDDLSLLANPKLSNMSMVGQIFEKRKNTYLFFFIVIILTFISSFMIFNHPAAIKEQKSIAVVPFLTINDHHEADYFCSGVEENIRSGLSQIGDLKVISREALMGYKGSPLDIFLIQKQLNVSSVLAGSISYWEDRICLTLRLFETKNEDLLWEETYDTDLRNLFNTQSDIIKKIASVLKINLSLAEKSRLEKIPTENLTAFQYYLKGRDYYYRYQSQSNENAIIFFKKALKVDSTFALAYAGLGDAYNLQVGYNASRSYLDSTIIVCERALVLDTNCYEAFCALGHTFRRKGKYEKALNMFNKAITRNPSHWMALYNLGELKNTIGLYQEGLIFLKRATYLNPTHATLYQEMAISHGGLKQYEEAELSCKKALELQPDFAGAYEELAFIFSEQEKWEQSVAIYQKALTFDPLNQWIHHDMAMVYANMGEVALAISELETSININPTLEWHYIGLAGIYIAQNQYEQAIQVYERALDTIGEKFYLCLHYSFLLSRLERIREAREIIKKWTDVRDDSGLASKIAKFYLGEIAGAEVENAFARATSIKYKHMTSFYSDYYCLGMAFLLNTNQKDSHSSQDTSKAIYYLQKYLTVGEKTGVEYPMATSELRRLGVLH